MPVVNNIILPGKKKKKAAPMGGVPFFLVPKTKHKLHKKKHVGSLPCRCRQAAIVFLGPS